MILLIIVNFIHLQYFTVLFPFKKRLSSSENIRLQCRYKCAELQLCPQCLALGHIARNIWGTESSQIFGVKFCISSESSNMC